MLITFLSVALANDVDFYDDWFSKYKTENVETLTKKVINELKRKSTQLTKETGFPKAFITNDFWMGLEVELSQNIRAVRRTKNTKSVADFYSSFTTYQFLEERLNAYNGLEGFSKILTDKHKEFQSPPLYTQSTRLATGNSIQVNVNKSKINSEKGRTGSQNGVVNPGEWLSISVSLDNTSRRRWFSSSLSLNTTSKCLWVFPNKKWRLPELPPKSSTSVELDVYIAESCSSNPSFSLSISDSVYGTQDLERITIKSKSISKARLVQVEMDRDMLGSSDGKKTSIIENKSRIEIRTKFQSFPNTLSIMGEFSIPTLAKGIFKSSVLSDRSLYSKDGFWRSTDDWDLSANDSIQRNVQAMAVKNKWKEEKDAKMLVAYDVLIESSSPENSRVVETKKTKIETTPFSTQQIVDMIPSYINLEANKVDNRTPSTHTELHVTKNKKGEIIKTEIVQRPLTNIITSDGTKVVLDKKALLNKLNSNTKKTVEVITSTIKPSVSYLQRHYFTIPLKWKEKKFEICNDSVDNDDDGLIDCNDPDCSKNSYCIKPNEICTDGIDNDEDGFIDCEDTDCRNNRECRPKKEICYDRIDNDEDGLVDCEDSDCANYSSCNLRSTPLLGLGFGTAFPTLVINLTGGEHFQYFIETSLAPTIQSTNSLINQFSIMAGLGYNIKVTKDLQILPNVGMGAALMGYDEFLLVNAEEVDSTSAVFLSFGLHIRQRLVDGVFVSADWKGFRNENVPMKESSLSFGLSFVLPGE